MESLAVFSGLSFCPEFRFWGQASSCLPVSWAIPSPYLTVPTGRHWCFWEGKSDTEEPEGSRCAPPPWVSLQHRGDLGNVHADADGRAIFRLEDKQLKIWDVIGRSLVIDEGEDDLGRGGHPLSKITGNSGKRWVAPRPVGGRACGDLEGPGQVPSLDHTSFCSLACGIIARSAGLFQNPKQICSCDGLTIWEERGRPIAGEGRKEPAQPSAHL